MALDIVPLKSKDICFSSSDNATFPYVSKLKRGGLLHSKNNLRALASDCTPLLISVKLSYVSGTPMLHQMSLYIHTDENGGCLLPKIHVKIISLYMLTSRGFAGVGNEEVTCLQFEVQQVINRGATVQRCLSSASRLNPQPNMGEAPPGNRISSKNRNPAGRGSDVW